jgi:hypothetical protein
MANIGSTGVEPLTLNHKIEGVNPAAVNTGMDNGKYIHVQHMVSGELSQHRGRTIDTFS